MSNSRSSTKDETEDVIEPVRPLSPPPHTTHAARGVHAPSFSSFQPRDVKITSANPVNHVAWSCDGRKLASVGVDKSVRLWTPEKSLEPRTAVHYLGGHESEVDYVAWNPTHPELFCSSSQRDKRVVFWDARQSRCLQTYSHSVDGKNTLAPMQLSYSPDGKTIAFVSASHQLSFMGHGLKDGDTKQHWTALKRDPMAASSATFNHAGDGLVLSHHRSNKLMIVDYPTIAIREQPSAHVGGCVAVALDPRGRYIASGGNDSLVNLFDTTECICCNTITTCDHSINALSFSHDGEYIAIASAGSYIDICATETTHPIHRVQTPGATLTITWHPSKYVIAYCGQAKAREGAPQTAFLSLFGPGM